MWLEWSHKLVLSSLIMQLVYMAGYSDIITCLEAVTLTATNWVQCRVISLIKINSLSANLTYTIAI